LEREVKEIKINLKEFGFILGGNLNNNK
jgi:hypothetical protein